METLRLATPAPSSVAHVTSRDAPLKHYLIPSKLLSLPPVHYGTKPGRFETSGIHFPTNERRDRASGPVLTSLFLFVLDHSAALAERD